MVHHSSQVRPDGHLLLGRRACRRTAKLPLNRRMDSIRLASSRICILLGSLLLGSGKLDAAAIKLMRLMLSRASIGRQARGKLSLAYLAACVLFPAGGADAADCANQSLPDWTTIVAALQRVCL